MALPTALLKLDELRAWGGPRLTHGLPTEDVSHFLALDPCLGRAIDAAHAAHLALRPTLGATLHGAEAELIAWAQADLLNFYAADAIQPYVPLAADGAWVVTTHGAVVYDSGGYGMLGFGHAPAGVLSAMAAPAVCANVMTPSLVHRAFTDALKREVGHTTGRSCPFVRFLCMNSGSEAVSVAARISDIVARTATDPGGVHAGKAVRFLAIEGGFHGRTDRPAQASPSSHSGYLKHLRTFRDDTFTVTTPANDVVALRETFANAERDGVYFEMMLVEPVMGEGRPGVGMTRAFYDEARRLTRQMGTLLLVDSIQAGLRAHGVLSVLDYPGFEGCEPPDLETWSKALNAAQYPMSVLGLGPTAAQAYVRGVYGNTMTAHPRAMAVGVQVLAELTPALRANIVSAGRALNARFEELVRAFPSAALEVTGTGLLVALWLDPATCPVLGDDGVEQWCRRHGLNVIHGGSNAVRLTPHFGITPDEVDLVARVLRAAIVHYTARAAA